VDAYGGETHFNPNSPGVPHRAQAKVNFGGLSCPDAGYCVSPFYDTSILSTFPPVSPRSLTRHYLNHQQPSTVLCKSRRACLVGSISGDIFTWAPATGRIWGQQRVSRHMISVLDCPTAGECVAIDRSGHPFVSR
jgi:hypothetical protein